MKDRPTILAVGDAIAATGFSRVMCTILGHLSSEYDIHHLGINYFGDPHDKGWNIYPASVGGDLQGINRLNPLVKKVRPDLIFILNDIWVLADYMKQLNELKPECKIIMYCPIDSGPIEPSIPEKLEGITRFVVYTGFAKAVVEEALASLKESRPDFSFPEIEVIPHGVDTSVFYPYSKGAYGEISSPGRQRAIKSLFGDDPDYVNSFILLNANRNQPRKRIDITIKGFALFAENKPDNVKLHLHMGVDDAGWNVIQLARRHKIDKRLILTTGGSNIPSVPDSQLNDIYNASVVGINTSIAEGWGLVSFEHAATGAAQIVPNHSACKELWQGAALMLEPVMSLTTEQILTEGKYVSPDGVAQALELLYQDPDLLMGMSKAAHENALDPRYQWDAIARRWHELFQNTLNE